MKKFNQLRLPSLLLILLGVAMGNLYSQDYEPQIPKDPRLMEALAHERCSVAVVKTASTILYDQGAAVYLEFSEDPTSFVITNQNNPDESYTIDSRNSLDQNGLQFLHKWLTFGQEYDVLAENSCEEWMQVGTFSTAEAPLTQGIEVSDALYASIVKFQRAGKAGSMEPFSNYLETERNVNYFEKIYFFQNYYNGREKISSFSSSDFPVTLRAAECRCEFILNNSQTAAPAHLNNGIIDSHIDTSGPTAMNSNEYNATSNVRYNRGASKYHQLWTEGSKAGGTEHFVSLTSEGDNVSTQFGRLRYNLFCQGYSQVPEECACDLPIRFYYRYDTRVSALAEKHSEGIGSKKAVSAAEDIATVVYWREGSPDVNVLASGSARVQAECEQVVNTQFWQNVGGVALEIGQSLIELSDSEIELSDLNLDDLTTSITELIETPYFSSRFCDQVAEVDETLALGSAVIDLHPNEPVDLYVFSNSDLSAGGKRSWYSWSRILSDFYLAGVVIADRGAGACCQEKQANWVFAGQLGSPLTVEDLRTQVGAELDAWSPWNFPQDPFSGVVIIPSEYGETFYDAGDCDPPVLDDPRRGRKKEEVFVNNLESLQLVDISGRVLYRERNLKDPNNIHNYLSELPIHLSNGIYFVQKMKAGVPSVLKIVISK